MRTITALVAWFALLFSTPTIVSAQPVHSIVYKSGNWSGYALTGSSFTEITATFNIPPVARRLCARAVSEWVGIDGTNNSDLIQTGVLIYSGNPTATSVGCGAPIIVAWWEILPGAEVPMSLTIHTGDSITATINEIETNTWLITLFDNTTGESQSVVLPYAGPLTSAEWIVEAPSTQLGVMVAMPWQLPIRFDELGVTGDVKKTMEIWLGQNGQNVGIPDFHADAHDLFAQGFSVIYN
jgi:hypothetical protein